MVQYYTTVALVVGTRQSSNYVLKSGNILYHKYILRDWHDVKLFN